MILSMFSLKLFPIILLNIFKLIVVRLNFCFKIKQSVNCKLLFKNIFKNYKNFLNYANINKEFFETLMNA